jgi:hypothetical protein
MPDKPKSVAGYGRDQVEIVRSACLYFATLVGDLADNIAIVGGLVPTLLVPRDELPEGAEPHVGTADLDIGLAVAMLEHERYRELASRLRHAGFEQDTNEAGNPTRQRWRFSMPAGRRVTLDFLIAPSQEDDTGGALRHLEHDFAAVITPGLELAFIDRDRIHLRGQTLLGEDAERAVYVCGPGAFTVLKALAFRSRGEGKDAYDLYYVLRYFSDDLGDVAARIQPLLHHPDTRTALRILAEDFASPNTVGPRRAAMFLTGGQDAAIQADVSGLASGLLRRCAVSGR